MFSFKTVVAEKGSALVMAILNITPDSFSDGGEAFSPDSVIEKVNELITIANTGDGINGLVYTLILLVGCAMVLVAAKKRFVK